MLSHGDRLVSKLIPPAEWNLKFITTKQNCGYWFLCNSIPSKHKYVPVISNYSICRHSTLGIHIYIFLNVSHSILRAATGIVSPYTAHVGVVWVWLTIFSEAVNVSMEPIQKLQFQCLNMYFSIFYKRGHAVTDSPGRFLL